MIGPRVNPLVRDTASPAILQARAWLDSYDGNKGPRIDLSQAAPPYPPPQELVDHLSAAAGLAETARYGPVPGEYELRKAYAEHASQLYDTTIDPQETSITAGCNQAFLIAAMLVAKKGDAVLLPTPWYFNHKMTLDMLGIEVRQVPCSADAFFEPSLPIAKTLIDNNVRAIVLVTPNNPTGAVYSPATIEAFADLCRDHGIWLILDETYRDFLPEGPRKPHSLFDDRFRNNIISLYSFSKSLALPGYRLGAMIYPARVAEHVIKVQDCVQICPARAGQLAVTWALGGLDEWRRNKRQQFSDKARAFRSAMADVVGWEIVSIGAYFAYIRHPFSGSDAGVIAERLASENGLLLIPGSFFGPGQARYLRLSFGNLTPESLRALPTRFRLGPYNAFSNRTAPV
jgi:aspartate/methionine/tyrosine aminotransferase